MTSADTGPDTVAEFRNPLAITSGSAYIVLVLGFAVAAGWYRSFPDVFPIALGVALAMSIVLWRAVITPRVVADAGGVRLVHAFLPPRFLPWEVIERFEVHSYRLPPWRKTGMYVTRTGKRRRLPGLMIGRSRREQEYLPAAVRALEARRQAAG